MTTITVHPSRAVKAPRAARLVAALFLRLLKALQRSSSARAQRRLQTERITDAAAVRSYAMRFAGHDPRFATDLLAAADRHERTA